MELRQLGQSELNVTPIIFGAWAIGGWYWGSTDDAKAIEAIHKSIDVGINMIDTAPMYGYGHSEKVVGEAVKDQRDKVLIATKCGLRWDKEEGVFFFDAAGDGSKKIYRTLKKDSIMEECERSLKRLQTDVIDLYQCHWPDKTTPLEETMEALLRLQEQGKIRAIGVSNFTVEMIKTCQEHGVVASDQPRYSLLDRKIEKDVLPYCYKNNVGLIVYSPLEQGLLTGKVTEDREFEEDDWRTKQAWFKVENRRRVLAALDQVKPIADKYNATFAQLAINWTIHEPGVTSAIVGARTPEQVEENAGAAHFVMDDVDRGTVRKVFEALGKPA